VESTRSDGTEEKIHYRQVKDAHIKQYAGKNITLKLLDDDEGTLIAIVGDKRIKYIDELAGRVTEEWGMALYGIDGKPDKEIQIFQNLKSGEWGAKILSSSGRILSYEYQCIEDKRKSTSTNMKQYCEDLSYQVSGAGETLVGYTSGYAKGKAALEQVLSSAIEYQKLARTGQEKCRGEDSFVTEIEWAAGIEQKVRSELQRYNRAAYLGSYVTEIGPHDHYNSRGHKLRKVADILQQDRANYHQYYKRDAGDRGDPFFTTRNTRSRIKSMLRNGSISAETTDTIMRGVGTKVAVDVYRSHIEVQVAE
jgi:hypothetical protein